MTDQFISSKDFYENIMKDIEEKFYGISNEELIQTVEPLFNQIKTKRNQREQYKIFVERIETLLKIEKVPKNIKSTLESAKDKMITKIVKLSETLNKIEKEEYAKVVLLTNMFMLEKIKEFEIENDDEYNFESKKNMMMDVEYWIKCNKFDYALSCAKILNDEEEQKPWIVIPSPLEIYYNYCKIS